MKQHTLNTLEGIGIRALYQEMAQHLQTVTALQKRLDEAVQPYGFRLTPTLRIDGDVLSDPALEAEPPANGD